MMEEERFIIETDTTEDVSPDEASKETRLGFPVRAQLLVLGLFLCVLFAGFIVPQTLALLETTTEDDTIVAGALEAGVADPSPSSISDLSLTAEAAYVWDVVGQRALYEKNPDKVLPLASITKLMTALVAYELVPDDTLVTISRAAAQQQSGGGLTMGESFAAKDLADFALISSYNSAAYTLATAVGELLGEQDPVTQFVAAMNIKAEELNLRTLSYKNPTGLDVSASEPGARGSARETAFLMEYILRNYPEILTPTVTEETRLYNQFGDYHEAVNTNTILADIPNVLGSKTGFTDLAGGNLTIAFDAGYNRPIIVTVLGSTHSERFSDVKKLVAAVLESMATEN